MILYSILVIVIVVTRVYMYDTCIGYDAFLFLNACEIFKMKNKEASEGINK